VSSEAWSLGWGVDGANGANGANGTSYNVDKTL